MIENKTPDSKSPYKLNNPNMSQASIITCYSLPVPAFNAPGNPAIDPVVVFYGHVSNIDDSIALALMEYLSPDELKRAEKFQFQADKINYISCRALLRNTISSHLNCSPKDLTISFSKYEKPYIHGNSLLFSISHSKGMFAIAFSNRGEPGLDIELIKHNFKFEPIIKSYFTPEEQKHILSKPHDDALLTFYLYWTRKEAFLKSIGIGITENLNKIEVLDGKNKYSRERDDLPLEKNYTISSFKIKEYFLSLALPFETEIVFREVKDLKDFLL